MKRIHLFEFEDFQWFPDFLRMCMTNYILTMHRLLGSADDLAELLSPILRKTKKKHYRFMLWSRWTNGRSQAITRRKT
jgi:hypothetical protein